MSNRKMGRERTLNNNNIVQLIPSIAEKVLSTDKNDIKITLELLENSKKEDSYNDKNMHSLFFFWKKYIPHHKQSVNCAGCRQAVLQFWKKVNQEWNK